MFSSVFKWSFEFEEKLFNVQFAPKFFILTIVGQQLLEIFFSIKEIGKLTTQVKAYIFS